jgi:hypothetical protein
MQHLKRRTAMTVILILVALAGLGKLFKSAASVPSSQIGVGNALFRLFGR